jgi:hypothetical protein
MLSAMPRKIMHKATSRIKCKGYTSIAKSVDLYRGTLLQKRASGDSSGSHFSAIFWQLTTAHDNPSACPISVIFWQLTAAPSNLFHPSISANFWQLTAAP